MTNVTSRNNILYVTRQAIADRTRSPRNDFDYDLFSASITAAEGQEEHGLRGVPAFVPECGLRAGQGVFALTAGSPGFDAGMVLPNFNDGFTGAAPDLGAHEAGSAPMEFGVDAYRAKRVRTTDARNYMLPSEAPAGWRKPEKPDDIHRLAGEKVELKELR